MNASGLAFLVVEDHEFQRQMLVRMLRALDARCVYAAGHGREALELLAANGDIDVIITDLDMPGMDGMEFIRHVGTANSTASLIIASALERDLLFSVESMSAAYGLNFLGTLEKPITPGKLSELLGRHRSSPPRRQPPKVVAPAYTIDEILDGLANDQFEPFFQPKIKIATGEVVGVEALARWRHPQQGIVTPYAFIKPLEDGGRIGPLFRCMLRKAAEFCRVLRAAGQGISVSVNLSLTSLSELTLADEITAIVRGRGVEPRDIVLEVTESAATAEVGKVLENLSRLRMKGFQLSIDDYGTGYASLEQLARIPFTELKIDQAFVTQSSRRESARVILEASIDLARKLKICAVAEGVETQVNWDLLRELGCDVAQGYYIAKPMSARMLSDWLIAWPQMQTRQRTVSRSYPQATAGRREPQFQHSVN